MDRRRFIASAAVAGAAVSAVAMGKEIQGVEHSKTNDGRPELFILHGLNGGVATMCSTVRTKRRLPVKGDWMQVLGVSYVVTGVVSRTGNFRNIYVRPTTRSFQKSNKPPVLVYTEADRRGASAQEQRFMAEAFANYRRFNHA